MPFSVPPPSRQDFTDRGGDWVDATIVWLRQFQDYVNRLSRTTFKGGTSLELAIGPLTGIAAGGIGEVIIRETNEHRTVTNPGTAMPGVSEGGGNILCWVQDDMLVGWFC